MTYEEHTGQEEVTYQSPSPEEDQTALAKLEGPTPPKGMSEHEADKVRSQAAALVRQLGEVSGSKELEILDNITNIGVQVQRNAAGYLSLLKARVNTFRGEGGPGREITKSMRDLRIALDQIDPHRAPRNIWDHLSNFPPFFGKNSPVRMLQRIALRYEPVSRQIAAIETKLRDGRTVLARDNLELRKLYEQIEIQQPTIRKNTFLGELLIQHLAQLIQKTPDPMKRERIRGTIHDVSMRVQDLVTMEEVHNQYFVSIEMSRQNNNRLGQAVDRTLTLSTNVVTVGFAIQSALIRQKSVMEATRRTREFLGTLVTANATAIKTHTQEIGDLYANPAIAIDKITQAHNELIEAMDIADQLRQESIEVVQENIARLSQLSAALVQRTSGLQK